MGLSAWYWNSVSIKGFMISQQWEGFKGQLVQGRGSLEPEGVVVWLRGFLWDKDEQNGAVWGRKLRYRKLPTGPSGKASEFLWDVKPLGLHNKAKT